MKKKGDVIDMDRVVLKIAERLRDKATAHGRIPFESGGLRKSIQVEHIGKGKAVVGSNLVYARTVHDGRPAITIRPNVSKNPPPGEAEAQGSETGAVEISDRGEDGLCEEGRQACEEVSAVPPRGRGGNAEVEVGLDGSSSRAGCRRGDSERDPQGDQFRCKNLNSVLQLFLIKKFVMTFMFNGHAN